jgi:hypothetical protein
MRKDRREDMTKLSVALRSFAKAPIRGRSSLVSTENYENQSLVCLI